MQIPNINDINLSQLAMWAAAGLIVGFIVHKIDPGDVKGGVIGTMIFGILGAIIGGFAASMLFRTSIDIMSVQGFATAIAGGLILAMIYRILFRGHHRIKTSTTSLR